MAEWSGFFDAHKVGDSWDRTYLAEDFAKFFAPLIGNGIFAGKSNELQVFQDVPASMSVVLSSGQSWIEGYGYVNNSDLKILVDPADGALGRIDRIVNQWSSVDRRIRTVWKKGTPAVNPVAPPLRWDADYKELNICILDVSAGLSAITQDKIRDTRADSSVCGWVTGLIDQVDTSTLFAQWESAYEKEFTEQKRAWEEFFKDIQLDLGIPVPSPDKATHVLAVDSNGGYTLSDKYTTKEYVDEKKVDKTSVVNNFTTTEPGFVADARALKVLNDNIEKISHIRELNPGNVVDITFGTYRTSALVFAAGATSKALCYLYSNGYLSPLKTVDNVSVSLSDDYKTITVTNNNGSGLYTVLGVLHLGTTPMTVNTRS